MPSATSPAIWQYYGQPAALAWPGGYARDEMVSMKADGTAYVQGLSRGLEVLAAVNAGVGSSVAETSRAVDLPRTTAARLLTTLARAGFLERTEPGGCYRPTVRVRTLSDGYDDEALFLDVASEHIYRLTRRLGLPLFVAVPWNGELVWRVNTDHLTTVALNHYPYGVTTPVLGTATGQIYLAHCSLEERRLALLLSRSATEPKHGIPTPGQLESTLQQIRKRGYAIMAHATTGRRQSEFTLAVPILQGRRFLASLAIRITAGPMAWQDVVARFQPAMAQAAAAIQRDLVNAQRRLRRRKAAMAATR